MDYRLQQDLDHFFAVFTDHVQGELHKFKATPEAKRLDSNICEEIELLRASVMNRLEEHFTARL